MLGLMLLGVMVPAIVVSGESGGSDDAASVVIPVIEPNADALRGCASLSGTVPCSTQRLALKLEATAAVTAMASDTPALQDTPVPQAAAEPESTAEPPPTMDVREGDTLLALATWFGVSPFDIAVTNGMSVDDYLQIGATIAIPVPANAFSIPPDPMAVVYEPAPEAEPEPEPYIPPAAPVITEPPATPYIPPSSSDVVAAICSLPWPCDQMVRVASCESGLNPRAVNPIGYYGLFQIDHQFGGWDDALTNATVAYFEKYLPALAHGGDGLSPWPVCRYY